jgi:hypothetical protein|nr:MAG TPA: hypothetical protein [Caudoviricetes sp.]
MDDLRVTRLMLMDRLSALSYEMGYIKQLASIATDDKEIVFDIQTARAGVMHAASRLQHELSETLE